MYEGDAGGYAAYERQKIKYSYIHLLCFWQVTLACTPELHDLKLKPGAAASCAGTTGYPVTQVCVMPLTRRPTFAHFMGVDAFVLTSRLAHQTIAENHPGAWVCLSF